MKLFTENNDVVFIYSCLPSSAYISILVRLKQNSKQNINNHDTHKSLSGYRLHANFHVFEGAK